jgi:hypothetical protein
MSRTIVNGGSRISVVFGNEILAEVPKWECPVNAIWGKT